MKQKKMLTLTFSQLKQIYGQEIPEIVEIADKSSTVEDFKAGILRLLETCRIENEAAEEAREQIRLLLDYDGQNVHELSTGQDMSVQTIRLLYEFLTGTLETMEMPTDLFIEIFQMIKRLKGEVMPLPSRSIRFTNLYNILLFPRTNISIRLHQPWRIQNITPDSLIIIPISCNIE